MLSLIDVTKIYRSRRYSVAALGGVSLDFPDKGMVFVLGRSGSGKTTLLNIIGGLDAPTTGELIVNGRSSLTFGAADFDGYRSACVGFVFQDYNLIEDYTAGENIAIALELCGRAKDRQLVEDTLRRVGLEEDGKAMYDRKTVEMSGGQRQRAAIARALVKDPQIILADEPTGALDSKTGAEIYELLKDLSADKLVIVVTHDRKSAEKYGDRIIELADGIVVSDTETSAAPAELPSPDDASYGFPRSRLPMRRVLAMGLSGMGFARVRLFFSVLLAVIAFSVFGFVLCAATVDAFAISMRTMADGGLRMVYVSSATYEKHRIGYNHTVTETIPLTDRQVAAIEEYSDGKPMTSCHIRLDLSGNLGESAEKLSALRDGNRYYYAALNTIDYALRLDPETGEEDARLTPDDRFEDASLCRLPEKEDEIAITDLHANMFMEFGYRGADGRITEISCPDDLIGKTLVRGTETGLDEAVYTICGVYSTEIDREDVEAFDYIYNDDDYYAHSYTSGITRSIMSHAFVAEDPSDQEEHSGFMIKMSGDADRDAAFLHGLEYSEGGRNYKIGISTPVGGFMSLPGTLQRYAMPPCIIASVVMAVFSVLLMASSLTASLNMKSRKLGVLRALGAGKPDIFAICLVESVAVALLEMILTSVAVPIMCAAFNSIFYVSLLFFGVGAFFAVFGLCFGSAALSTILPVAKLMRKKPVDIIAGR